MAIDLMFLIMVSYGFYFGYAYGLIRVVIFVLSLVVAMGVAMYVTPTTTKLLQETLEINSALLPFISFVVTLVGVMLLARILFMMLEENINSKQINKVTQLIGGLLMSAVFTFLFSVLITFFSAASVIKPTIRENSKFLIYIEKIPVHGTDIIRFVMPFMEGFLDYMRDAFERLEKEQPQKPKNIFDDFEDNFDDDYRLDTIPQDTSRFFDEETLDSLGKDIKVDTSRQNSDAPNSDLEITITPSEK